MVARWQHGNLSELSHVIAISRDFGITWPPKTWYLFTQMRITNAYNQWITVRVRVGQVDADLRYINIDNFRNIDNMVVDSGWTRSNIWANGNN